MPPSPAPATVSAPATIPLHETPAGSFRALVVVAEPGVYEVILDGLAARPRGQLCCRDPLTGNWLALRLVHQTTGEVRRPANEPVLHYQQA